jgi:hypothetical protein
MPIYLGAPMDENPPGAGPSVIFTAAYGLERTALQATLADLAHNKVDRLVCGHLAHALRVPRH